MTATEYLFSISGAHNEHSDITRAVDACCALCGSRILEGIYKKRIITDAFTNWDFISQSDYFCIPCANILKGELSRSIRTSSFYATASGIQLFKFFDLSQMLFMKHETPFVLCFTSSFKKHNAFRAVLNDSDEQFTVRWEDRAIEINREECTRLFRVCVGLYYGGFTKEEIANNTFALHRMKYGVDRFNEHCEMIRPYFRTNLLEFLCEALPSRKRETYVKIIAEREKAAKAAKGANKDGRKTGTDKRGKSGQTGLFPVEEH
ncbi:MAG TPA: hypothetical protein PLO55_12370 [Thermotogota bacterium]|nr:hypothetical protein [Thermotogota bacterium]